MGILTACGRQEDGAKTTIEFFLGKRECTSTFESLIQKFESENPDIRVNLSAPSDPISILKTRLIKNDEPDLAAVLGLSLIHISARSSVRDQLTVMKGLQ